jgi:ABC-2 type transport system ATP-binding protein
MGNVPNNRGTMESAHRIKAGGAMPTVVVSKLHKQFGEVTAVRDVSFEVDAGEIFGLLGPNGAGKTTTIRIMLGIYRADAGHVSVLGGELDEAKKNRIGYLPEDRGLYLDQKLESTLVYLATLKGLSEAEAKRRLPPWLERMDLLGYRAKKISELSKGMQQKAQLIAALAHQPELIVLDEPFSGLDPVNTRLVKDILEELASSGCTIMMSTHQMFQVEALCNRIALIDRGSSVLYGTVDEIKRSYAGNSVLVHGLGDFEGLPGVVEARRQDGDWHLTLAAGTDPQSVFQALAMLPGARIDRFEIAEPSLDDIFISVVAPDEPPDNE